MDAVSLLHTTSLAAGQRLVLAVDAGTTLVAARGALRVEEAPRWLAERMVPVARQVGEGQAHVVERSGWLCVQAVEEAQLVRLLPRTPMARLRDWLLRRRGAVRPAAC
ncbi:MAG: hypothetical protein QM777_12265 [Pseudorhodoferax sp.]